LKWVEINVGIGRDDPETLMEVLLDLVGGLVTEFKRIMREGYTWHYLWESNPWPITLRLRFYGDDADIDRIKHGFQRLWNSLKTSKPNILMDYCYGRHGECCKEYIGEDDIYGSKGWELVKKMLNFGSEVALELIKNIGIMRKSNEFKTLLDIYVDRYVHLFLNQISPLFDELNFHLTQLVYRYFLYITGNYPSEEVINEVAEEILQTLQQKAKDLQNASHR